MASTQRPNNYNSLIRKMRKKFGFDQKFTFEQAFVQFGDQAPRTQFGEFMAYANQVGAMKREGEVFSLINPNFIPKPSLDQQQERAAAADQERRRLAETVTVEEAEAMVRRAVAEATAGARRREEDLRQSFYLSTDAASEQIHRLQGAGRKYLDQGNLRGAMDDVQFRITIVRSLARSAQNQWMNFGSWCSDLLLDLRWPAGTFKNSAVGRVIHLISQAHSGLIEHRKGQEGAQFKLGPEGCAIVGIEYVPPGKAFVLSDLPMKVRDLTITFDLVRRDRNSILRRAEAAEEQVARMRVELEALNRDADELAEGVGALLDQVERLEGELRAERFR